MTGKVTDSEARPIAGAVLDVWETAPNALYNVQEDAQSEWNMRGKFRTNDKGEYVFIANRPVPYSIPVDGPVGSFLKLTGRHSMRPAHIHFKVTAQGHQDLVTHLFAPGDEYLDSDAVFAVKKSLIATPESCDDSEMAERYGLSLPFTRVNYDFGLTQE